MQDIFTVTPFIIPELKEKAGYPMLGKLANNQKNSEKYRLKFQKLDPENESMQDKLIVWGKGGRGKFILWGVTQSPK